MPDAALLLVCGIGSDRDSWRDQIAALGQDVDCRTIVPQGEDIAAMAKAILGDAPPRFALAGHSLGGYVALAMHRAAPDRIDRLALMNSSAAADSQEQRDAREKLLALVEKRGFATVAERLATIVGAGDAALADRYRTMLERVGKDRFGDQQRAAMTRPDALTSLSGIACPTLVIGSSGDPVVAPQASLDIAAAVPHGLPVMLDSKSHAGPMAEPERVTAAMRTWLGR